MSRLMRKLMLASAAMALAGFAHAQTTVIVVPGPASGSADTAAQPQAPMAPADQPASSGAAAAQGASAAGGGTPVMQITEFYASNPNTDGSNDPLIQRRKAKAQAKDEYKSRMEAAKSEYKQEKRDARAEYRQDKREANQQLRAADPVTPNDRVNYGHGMNRSSGQ